MKNGGGKWVFGFEEGEGEMKLRGVAARVLRGGGHYNGKHFAVRML